MSTTTLDRTFTTSPPQRDFAMELCEYYTLVELAELLASLDMPGTSRTLTVLLALDPTFKGDLLSLIARTNPGFRLTLAKLAGECWLPISAGDLMAKSAALGWQQIVVERDLDDALRGTLESMESGEQLVVLWPKWRDATSVRRELFGDAS